MELGYGIWDVGPGGRKQRKGNIRTGKKEHGAGSRKHEAGNKDQG